MRRKRKKMKRRGKTMNEGRSEEGRKRRKEEDTEKRETGKRRK